MSQATPPQPHPPGSRPPCHGRRRCRRAQLHQRCQQHASAATASIWSACCGCRRSTDAHRGRAAGARLLDRPTRGVIVHALLEQIDLRAARSRPTPRRSAAPPPAPASDRPTQAAGRDRALVVRLPRQPAARAAREREGPAPRAAVRVRCSTGSRSSASSTSIAPRGDRTLIVDWKSDRLAGADPGELVARAYGLQRAAYALAALRDGATEVEVVHCFLERPDAPVARDLPPAGRARARRGAAGRARRRACSRATSPSPPDPGPRICDGCPGRGSLCSWPLERTHGAAHEGQLF